MQLFSETILSRKLRERNMGRLVRKPQVPDLDSQVAGLNGVQPGLPSCLVPAFSGAD
jgi:hypothetical protein